MAEIIDFKERAAELNTERETAIRRNSLGRMLRHKRESKYIGGTHYAAIQEVLSKLSDDRDDEYAFGKVLEGAFAFARGVGLTACTVRILVNLETDKLPPPDKRRRR